MAKSARKDANKHPARNGGGWCRPDKRLAIYLRDGLACAWCGHTLEDGEWLTLDHVKPHSHGGTNEPENLLTACRRCNCSRGNRSVIDFAKSVADFHQIDVGEIVERIDELLAKDLAPYRDEAKRIIARRETAKGRAAA